MAEGGADKTIECGYCLQNEEQLQDLRVLPCNHVYCKSCLESHLEEQGVIDCRSCR